jgi:voltage-gated potassium channel
MNKNLYLLIATGAIIVLGTFLMYGIESKLPNTHMKTVLDALWWCVATVTTVGYGDIFPVSGLGRAVALVYMYFGIAMISIFLSAISSTFYLKRIEKAVNEKEKAENERKEREMKYLRFCYKETF